MQRKIGKCSFTLRCFEVLGMVALIIYFKPYSEQSDFRFQIFIEVMAQVYLYALLCLSEFQPLDTQTRLDIGDFLIAIVTLVFLLSVLRVLLSIGMNCRLFWIKLRNSKKKVIQIEVRATAQKENSHAAFKPYPKKNDETPRFLENTIVVQPLVEEAREDASILDQTRCIQQKEIEEHQSENSEEDKEASPPRIGWLSKKDALPNNINKFNETEQIQQLLELPPISSLQQQSLHTFRINTSLVTISERDMPIRTSRANLHKLDESSEQFKDSIDFQQ